MSGFFAIIVILFILLWVCLTSEGGDPKYKNRNFLGYKYKDD